MQAQLMQAQLMHVVLAPWRQRDRNPWLRGLIYGGFVLLMAALLWFLPPRFQGWLIATTAALVVQGLWWWLGSHLLEQNHPSAARLVPGHVQGLRRAALLGWALATAWSTLCLGLMLPDWWREVALASGALAVMGLWFSRRPVLWLLVWLLWSLGGSFRQELAPLQQALLSLWRAQGGLVLLLALGVQAGLVALALGNGNSRHQRRYARMGHMRKVMRMQAEGQPVGAAGWGAVVEWGLRPYHRLHAAWLRHALQPAQGRTPPTPATPASVMARAAVVLHGPSHWVHHALVATSFAVLAVLALLAAWLKWGVTPALVAQHGGTGLAVGLVSIGLNPVLGMGPALWTSRREQALLRLLPGLPQGQALNRAVAGLQLQRFAWSWLLTLGLTAGVALLSGKADWLCLPLAALPFAALTLVASPAAMPAPSPMRNLLPFLGFYALASLLVGLTRGLDVPLGLLAAPVVVVSAGLLAWQWQRIQKAPTALPAGRM